MPLQATSGAASYDAYGGGAAAVINYIEDVFSTYLYTGNGVGYPSGPTITNGIDLAGKGGMVWGKARSSAFSNWVYDTARGVGNALTTNGTDAEYAGGATAGVNSFNSNGFGFGDNVYNENSNGVTYVSWTFRKQPKFFDVVTYTGNSVAGRTVAHNLGSVPGSIIVKEASAVNDWLVYHRNDGTTAKVGLLNSTQAAFNNSGNWFGDGTSAVPPTSTEFTVSTSTRLNASGETYVAYLFAHNAGGFGLTGTDNVISCGSYTGSGALQTITLGYEPQWLLVKRTDSATGGTWGMFDTMRQMSVANASGNANLLVANTNDAEALIVGFAPIATGFQTPAGNNFNLSGGTYIYIAIRRGPMKVPTDATKVFSPTFTSVSTSPLTVTTNFPVDLTISRWTTAFDNYVIDRLRGASPTSDKYLFTNTTDAENNISGLSMQSNTAVIDSGFLSGGSNPKIYWNFRRAPGFFDEVCWTGDNGSNQRVSHNLGVVPELIIYKGRNKVNYWRVYFGSINTYIQLDAGIAAVSGSNFWGSSAPTTTDFGINCGSMDLDNFNAVGYLFATCAGVSKVGSYTGTGTTQTINCGFTGGARFVLIKRTDSTGDWYVWDTARGIVAGNDSYLLLNSTAAEVTSTDYIDTASTGFEISSTAPAAINANGGSFIFLAIA